MFCYHCLWLLIFIFSPSAFAQTTDKYTDENRPYKFGFNIEGYQHRQEQKDEKGIIKGEYGFITADGYYRVTVYATDENGDFRIISMKNYYVGFPPEDPTTTPGSPTPGQIGAGLKPFGATSGRKNEDGGNGSIGASSPQKEPVKPQGKTACSSCYIPTTSKPSLAIASGGDGKDAGGRPETGSGRSQEKFPGPINLNSIPDSPNASPKSNFEKGKTSQLESKSPRLGENSGGFGDPRSPVNSDTPGNSGILGTPINSGISGMPGTSDLKHLDGKGAQKPSIPGSEKTSQVQGQFDNLQNNGPNKRKPQIGEVRDGLPPGVPVDTIKDLLLYTFNYTVGFHGHHEDGYRSGDKEGDYFFDGRDGVERQVKYLANEFGYQPNITLTELQENDVRSPKEETEKEYGLKGYEFKWFYRK